MDDKFQEMKKEAITQMAILAECNVENSWQGVCDAVAHVFEHGTYRDGAKALMIASQWMWADCEERYHEKNMG